MIKRSVLTAKMDPSVPTANVRDGQGVTTVHGLLKKAILRSEIEPGQSISQTKLARDFGIGRTPLREALRLLQREGLVIAVPNRRVQIAGLTAEDFEEILIARLALETIAIRITVPTLASADFGMLEGCMAQMDHYQKEGDQAGLRGPHRAFHHALIVAAGLRVVAEISELTDHAERYRLRFNAFGDWVLRRAEHRAIFDAAASGDPDQAARCLAEHYVRTSLLLFNALGRGYDFSRLCTTLRVVAPGIEAMFKDG